MEDLTTEDHGGQRGEGAAPQSGQELSQCTTVPVAPTWEGGPPGAQVNAAHL